MIPTHLAIVWNPTKTTKADLAAAVPDDPELTVSWHETDEDDPGRSAAESALAAGADVIAAAGGDGTVRAVAGVLAESGDGTDLGILPLGTGNLLARNLEVPLGDLDAAMERVLTGEGQTVDIGWVELATEKGTERHPFAVMAGFGLDAHMITETDDDLKDRAGWLAYVESLGRAVSASDIIDLRLSVDDGPDEMISAHTLIVGNCGSLQGGITLLPDADPSDGLLDIVALESDGVTGWLDTVRNMVWDNGLRRLITSDSSAQSSDTVEHRRAASARIELDAPRIVEVDGDELDESTRIRITVQPGAVRVR